MLTVLFPRRKWGSPGGWQGIFWSLSFALLLSVPARAQTPPSSKKDSSGSSKSASAKSTPPGAPSKQDAGKTAVAPDVAAPAARAGDPSQTRKIAPNEVFRDPKAEALIDVAKLTPVQAKPVSQNDINELKAQAGGVNVNIDKDLIARVVGAMAAKLTDRANVQALVDPPEGQSHNSPAFRGIQEATTTLLEPLFLAKSIKNQPFLTIYYRTLKEKLTPLLKNHLIPRVQAMIVLGECGTAEFLSLYEAQIRDPNQTVWVKLWALEGMVNVVDEGGRLSAQDQIVAAKTVADFLDKEDDLPWPVQLRALEALSSMRQGFEPNKPQKADMANVAMSLLADSGAKLEVRSEAARALGAMQISAAVPKYNYSLVAHAAGQLGAELGNRIGTGFTSNQDKAKYLTALLIGPVYQAFDGVPGARDSGLLHASAGEPAAYIQKVFDLVKPVARAAVDLIAATSRQVPDRQKDLAARVAALKTFLEANAPPDRHLVQNGAEFPLALLPGGGLQAPPAPAAAPLAGPRNNR
jgi:hypothetical protein